jgi:hypothetical protein
MRYRSRLAVINLFSPLRADWAAERRRGAMEKGL